MEASKKGLGLKFWHRASGCHIKVVWGVFGAHCEVFEVLRCAVIGHYWAPIGFGDESLRGKSAGLRDLDDFIRGDEGAIIYAGCNSV